ncbi:MAG TPA: hypothetical protein VNH64_03370 [Parvularculaceae bacterium]|nr:hypothetical protein [Parvularculaceae bacterium]
MDKAIFAAVSALILASSASAAAQEIEHKQLQPAPPIPDRAEPLLQAKPLDEKSAQQLKALGAKAFGIKWRRKTVAAADRGFQVVTDNVMTISYRPSGNAYFVQDLARPMGKDPGFQGSDDQIIGRGKEILKAVGANLDEIADAKILQQYTQLAEIDASGRPNVQEPKADRRTLLMTRAAKGVPIWSSRFMLDLNRDGSVAALEIVWPQLSPEVMKEALEMQKVAAGDFRPPKIPYAKVESVEAGILHSPAASFVDDQTAAIRVIYQPTDPSVGKKAVSYLKLDGSPVAMPRQMADFREEPAGARKGEAPTLKLKQR